ncbi:hypothetical protein ACJVC5_13065 [Peredibacter sp. HCB2-198]|uniref:hypothetical protein n=1 Tax=Peredibacter sp. HCB2-198 TaxID=3383025 RepID=UPI0038B5301B
MKYLFPVLVTALFGMALTPAAEIKKNSDVSNQVETVKDQQISDQENVQQREEVDESEMINEFGQVIEMDNGNGTTTNRRINWPEP